jgi:hypothetical protein
MIYLKVLSDQSPGYVEENNEKLESEEPVNSLALELGIC